MPREKLLPSYRPGFRLNLRDPHGLAQWLATSIARQRKVARVGRSQSGRPQKFDLAGIARATRVSVSTLSKLLAPATRPGARAQRYVTVGVLRGLARLADGDACLTFVFAPRDRSRADQYFESISTPLSEPEATLLLAWLDSPMGDDLRRLARRLTNREFDRLEVMAWLRWVLSPFVATGINSVVARSWDELTERERRGYLSGALRLVERLLARRQPARIRLLQASESIDWADTLGQIAMALGLPAEAAERDSLLRQRPLTGIGRRAK